MNRTRLAALRAALDEGEASPDVENFDPETFLQNMKKTARYRAFAAGKGLR
jgi:Arc/MetJ-type ribon-helix-helix transcriptional regulator